MRSTESVTVQGIAIGIDVGGTFTDLASIAPDGRVRTTKVLSTPRDRAAGVLAAVQAAEREASLDRAAVSHITHGTTVVTNLLLERTGARVVLCATAGFTDLLELRRQERAALYDLARQHPLPLVDAAHTVAVRERVVPEGVLTALDADALDDVVRAVQALEPDTVAIALLHAYADPRHERMLRDELRKALHAAFDALPETARAGRDGPPDVICSHEVLPEIREYERTATTVAEAYARPAVRRYLGSLRERLAEVGLPAPRVMTSAGGTLESAGAALHAASLALSGPAGGVTGAAAILRALEIPDALTIDIGGTSADVGLILHGEPMVERGGVIAGVPIAVPRVLVEAVAAGGGSIGWIDEGGALRAGPESAGASPGPAAYGLGGTRATVTDAHVVLGNVAAGSWSGGVTIDAGRASEAIRPLAERLGVTIERAASALVATADATMARALRRISVERGIDPRQVALVAFGGGGPLQACGLAEGLGITRIVIPPHAGVLSAVGLALAPERREGLASLVSRLDELNADALAALLEAEHARLLSGDAGDDVVAPVARLRPMWWLRSRYVGQGHELDIPVSPGDSGALLAARFVEAHRARTGFTLERGVECISLRTALVGEARAVDFARHSVPADDARTGMDLADDVDDGRMMQRTLHGPAVVRLPDATLRVADGWTARALPTGGWLLEKS
ncbi:MAG: hydantoinase/oxoprolinase family protein [Gemmatimonadota bacterium]